MVVRDLRFSARRLAEAERAGRRVRPEATRRRVRISRLPRLLRDSSVAVMAAQEERRARQRLRAEARSLVRLIGSRRGAPLDLARAEDADIPPARHRRGALWLA
ncbi:hypothetical protein J7I97_17645 [Streptomyces sp. ISL-87]|nr:hypothetical protein [Streptomyces sp. ISL-86]MBT2610043.1 hypothetical protein [Streptomyces sp. ISL-87]